MNNNCGRLERSKLSETASDVTKSIYERLECYLFHVFIKRSQATSFVENIDAATKTKMPDRLNEQTSCANATVQNVFGTKKVH